MHISSLRGVITPSILGMIFVLVFSLSSFASIQAQESEEEIGFVEITVVHLDGEALDPDEFLSQENFQLGQYSVFDDDGDFVIDAASCNMVGSSCELALEAGIYEAIVADPNSLSPVSATFEVTANATSQVTVQVDQGSIEISVLDEPGDDLSSVSDFGHPGTFLESGWFAMFESDGKFILDSVTCNYDDEDCSFTYDSGTYIVAVRDASDDVVISCQFDVTDNEVSRIEFYLESDDCNQTVTQLPSTGYIDDDDSTNGGTGNNGNSGSNDNSGSNQTPTGSNSNTGSTPTPTTGNSGQQNATGIQNPLERKSVSILHTSNYIDNLGHYHLIGEVQNTQRIPAQDVVITAVFYGNQTKEVLSIKRAQTFLDYLRPGDKSPFDIVVKDTGISSVISNYKVNAAFSNTTSSAKKGTLGVEVINHYYSNETNQYIVQGRLFNYGDMNAKFVEVTLSVYDNSTNLLYVSQKYVTSVLLSESLREFTLAFTPKNATEIAAVWVSVQSDEFLMIGSANKLPVTPITVTLDSTSYDNGEMITVNGTIGNFVSWDKYATVYILFPNKINSDKEIVRITENGTYSKAIGFYAWEGFRGETFVVRIIYNNNFAEESFIFDSKLKSTATGSTG